MTSGARGGVFRVLAVGVVALSATACTPQDQRAHDPSWGADYAFPSRVDKSESRLVAVLDGGILSHPSLAGRTHASWSAPSLEGQPRSSHATEVAGLIVGSSSQETTPVERDVKVLDVRVLDRSGHGTPQDVASGIDWAVEHGADVISMSFRLTNDDPLVRLAVERAAASHVTLLASAANDLVSGPAWPAAYPGVTGVTSFDSSLNPSPRARAEHEVVAAPGDRVLTTTAGGALTEASGTSMATALAAAVVTTCLPEGVGKTEVIALAKKSGVTVTYGERELPVLRCP